MRLTLLILFIATTAFAATENLDEALNRKSRVSSGSYTRAVFENVSSTGYKWQPETLAFSNISTNHEVWRFTHAPGKNYTQDIGYAHWSADGNRLIFQSNRQNVYKPAATASEYTWFLSNTDGSKLRPGQGLSCADANWSGYPAWNPVVRDRLYFPGDGKSGRALNVLYANTVTDTRNSHVSLLSIDGSVTRRIFLKKGMAGDGSKLQFWDLNNFRIFVADLGTGTLDTGNTGYSGSFNWDTYWGDTVSPNTSWHDNYVAGAAGAENGIWNYHMGSGTHTWWRNRLTGTGADSAPTHTQDRTAPYLWGGELEVVNASTEFGTNDPLNYAVDYTSHFTMDRWGKYGIHSKSDNSPYGTSLFDVGAKDYWNAAKAFSGGMQWVQHHSWDAWSDWSASSGGPDLPLDYTKYAILIQNFNDPTSQTVIAHTHNYYNGTPASPVYQSVPRPTQSPDGTKVAFSSTFLMPTDDDVQIFWTVAYNPYPPFISALSATGGVVTITADWDLAGTPRGYTTRGWPNEATDLPPPPREISKFRLWRSINGTTWTAVKTFDHDVWDKYDFSDGSWTGDDFWTVTDAVEDGTYYYGITSLETSGLESQKLSNIKKVVVSGGTGTVTDHAVYPSAPGGKTSFYTSAPDAVQNPSFTYKKSPATSDGQYTIEWTAPTNKTLVRYYNIYAKDGSAPTAVQQTRIASVPATAADTSFSYVDWLGATDGSTKYIVTSVDFQGNESTADAPAEGDAIAPVTTPSHTGKISGKTAVTLTSSEAGTTSYCYGAAVCNPATNYTGAVTVKPGNYLCFASSDATPNTEETKCQYYGFSLKCQ